MSVTIRKGLIGKQDVNFYTSASPTFVRTTSTGGSTTLTAISATHIPLVQASGSRYFSQNTLQRAANELISRYFGVQHSTSTYNAGASVGHHLQVFGYRNGFAATSLQAAASNQFLRDGSARIVVGTKTTTAATPIQLPRKCILIGNGRSTVFRASSTIQTSRVFSISGTAGATSQALGSAVSAGATQLAVSNGAQFVANGWVSIQAGLANELQKVRNVAGNNLNLFGRTRQRYSTATVKVIYPAELYLDNLEIQLSSATQGIGIAATYLVQSVIGPNVRIVGAAQAGVKAMRSDQNDLRPQIIDAKSLAAGKGYGVWLTQGSGANVVGGVRQYVKGDVADGSSNWNMVWGVQRQGYPGSAVASGIANPISLMYRMRKPELSYTSYSVSGTATNVVSCPADTNAPAEVYIDGQIYKNTGTTLCDLSRTKTPAAATIGGLDRGPATATRAFYIYAVPTQSPSATRQFDLVASTGDPASGLTASATFPQWSFLGVVGTAATIRVMKFVQTGDYFGAWDGGAINVISRTSPLSADATFKQVRHSLIPVGAKSIDLQVTAQWTALAVDAAFNGASADFAHGDAINVSHYYDEINLSRAQDAGSGAQTRPALEKQIKGIPLNSNRFFAYRNTTAASMDFTVRWRGFTIPRSSYK